MKWSGVLGAGAPAKSMGAGRAKSPCEWVSRGRDSPIDPWFGAGGEGRLQALRVIDRRNGLLALQWVQYPRRAMAGGMQRERAAGSLAKMRGTTPHILRVIDKRKTARIAAIQKVLRRHSNFVRSHPKKDCGKFVNIPQLEYNGGVKQLGAIAALKDIVAFNTEVASELRAVFADFRTTTHGQSFTVAAIENFQTDEFGLSTFAMYNMPGTPDFSFLMEIQPSGSVEISMQSDSPKHTEDFVVPIGSEIGGSPAIAAARVVVAVVDRDHLSSFGRSFRQYVSDRLDGREPELLPKLDFPGKQPE